MTERISALHGHCKEGRFGEAGDPGVRLQEVRDITLQQIAAWPEAIDTVGEAAAAAIGAQSAPGPGSAVSADKGSLLRIEPLKWWLYGAEADPLDSAQGAVLDLSHSRTQVRITGTDAQLCLNRLIPIDLRNHAFAEDSVATTSMHHVAVTVWRSSAGYELFLPRGFALSLWEVLFDTAVQFGVEVD